MDVLKVEKIKEVLPPNYEADMKRLKQLERQCYKLQQLVDYGNMSNLQTLIEQFTLYARVQLKKISVEVQFTEYGNVEYELIQEFMSYLIHIKDELNALIVSDKKLLENSSPFSIKCTEEMEIFENKLHEIEKCSLAEDKLKELFFTLKSFNEILNHFDQVEKNEVNNE